MMLLEKRPMSLDKLALKIRKELAKELAPTFLSEWNGTTDKADSCHFEFFLNKLPLADARCAVEFGTFLTGHAIKKVCEEATDPKVMPYLAAKIVEQRFYIFIDPNAPEEHHTNLQIAKHYGTFFTPSSVASLMAAELLEERITGTILDPCSGAGSLLAAVMLESCDRGYTEINLSGIELDSQTAEWSKQILYSLSRLLDFSGRIEIESGDSIQLLHEKYIPLRLDIKGLIINPPYGRIRFQRDRLTNAETKTNSEFTSLEEFEDYFDERSSQVRDVARHYLVDGGIQDYARLFLGIASEMAALGARVSIITPDAWLSSKDASSLREKLIKKYLIEKVFLYREDAKLFPTVNQPTSVTVLSSKKKDKVHLIKFQKNKMERTSLSMELLSSLKHKGYTLPKINGDRLEAYLKLDKMQKIKDVPFLLNARGEIDQSFDKSAFQLTHSKIPLVRGEHIERFSFRHTSDSKKPSFLEPEYYRTKILTKPKGAHFVEPRIIGRQCSYMSQPRRLMFALAEGNVAVGNSCNYLIVTREVSNRSKQEILLFTLGVLNSSVLDWYFRAMNSNNHVANYEIDDLPFLDLTTPYFESIANITKAIAEYHGLGNGEKAYALEHLLDAYIVCAFGLDDASAALILEDSQTENLGIIKNYISQIRNGLMPKIPGSEAWFNHEEPTLSQLDRQIISFVPEGGNWQNIPEEVPSERLKQIREMTKERGVVRTTYYGRLRRDQPSYTISTYYNRPGNGTHIHPILDRTLTSREAARLQSFPDTYYFLGRDGAIRDQVGNAVPPLLARAIGQKFVSNTKENLCVDIFCGAGGLSLGLEHAGWDIIAAIDNDAQALNTYRFNRPTTDESFSSDSGTLVLQEDLYQSEAFGRCIKKINAKLNGRKLDLLVGGPPCQGFSHAGFRNHEDIRNDLAAMYLAFAETLRPRIFILENVEGLLTFKQGKVLADIVRSLEEMGYRTNKPVWKLCAEEYGVPQMRRRVFVVATLDSSVDLSPPSPTHEKCLGRREARQDHSLFATLESPLTVEQALAGLSMPNGVQPEWFSEWLNSLPPQRSSSNALIEVEKSISALEPTKSKKVRIASLEAMSA